MWGGVDCLRVFCWVSGLEYTTGVDCDYFGEFGRGGAESATADGCDQQEAVQAA